MFFPAAEPRGIGNQGGTEGPAYEEYAEGLLEVFVSSNYSLCHFRAGVPSQRMFCPVHEAIHV